MAITQLDSAIALIAIDTQKGIVPPLLGAQEMVTATARLAEAFHEAGKPVVWVHAVGLPSGRTNFEMPAGEPREDFAQLVDDLPVLDSDQHFNKQATSPFAVTDIHEWLQERGITQVVITGIATGMGVLSTAFSAYDKGYNVAVASDATFDFNPARGEATLTQLLPAIAQVGTVAEITDKLS